MATKDQYEFFKYLYDEQDHLHQVLESRAKLYLSVITAFVVAYVLKVADIVETVEILGIPWIGMLLGTLVLGVSFLFVLNAVRIRTYEGVNHGDLLYERLKDVPPTEEEFLQDRCFDFALAASRNRLANARVARSLENAGWALLLGVAAVLSLLLFAIGGPHEPRSKKESGKKGAQVSQTFSQEEVFRAQKEYVARQLLRELA